MTVAELIEELKNYDPDEEVLIRPTTSNYVETVAITIEREVNTFWDEYEDDYDAVLIVGDEQCGTVSRR